MWPRPRLDPAVLTASTQWETTALGWTGQNAYLRLPDPRYRFTAVWLDAADVRRR